MYLGMLKLRLSHSMAEQWDMLIQINPCFMIHIRFLLYGSFVKKRGPKAINFPEDQGRQKLQVAFSNFLPFNLFKSGFRCSLTSAKSDSTRKCRLPQPQPCPEKNLPQEGMFGVVC